MFDHYQIELFADPPAKALPGFSEYLNEGVGGPVHVTLTRNRVTMVSVQFTLGGGARVRAHEQFATAAESVWRSLRTYLRTQDRSQWEDVVAFAQSIQVADAEHRTRADSKGQVYDLNTHFRDTIPDVVTLPEHFKAQGYYVQALGKLFHITAHHRQEDQ